MPQWYRRTWCGCSRAATPCLSSCCSHDIAISVNFAKSLKFSPRDCRGLTSLASGSFQSRITATHWYASRISWTSPQCALWRASRMRPGVVVSGGVVVSRLGLRKLSRGFSLTRRPLLDASLSRSVILWTASVKLVSIDALRLSLLLSLL